MAASPSRAGLHRAGWLDPTAIGVLLAIFLTEAVIGILLLAVNPQYPKSELHAGAGVVGLAFSVYFAAKTIGQPLSGLLADRIRPRWVLVAGIVLCIPTVAWMLTLRSTASYLGAWLLFGLTLSVVWPAMYAIVGRHFQASTHARLLAIVSAAQIAGTAAGTEIGAVLIDHVSYAAAFLVAGVMLALAALASGGAIRDTTAPPKERRATSTPWLGWLRVINADTGALIAVITVLSLAVSMLAPDLKPYSDHVLRLPYSTFVLLLIPPAVLAGVLLLPAGWLADHAGRALPTLAGLLLFGVGLALLTLASGARTALIFACIGAAGYVLAVPALSALLLDLSTPRNRGLLTGVASSIQAVGGIIGPALGGALITGYGARAPLRAAAAVVLLSVLLAIPFALRLRRGTARIAG